jgi:hypothetical protein
LSEGVHRDHGDIERHAGHDRVRGGEDERAGAGLVRPNIYTARAHHAALVGQAQLGLVAGVERRAAGQEGQRWRGAAVVSERAEQGIDGDVGAAHEVAVHAVADAGHPGATRSQSTPPYRLFGVMAG